MRLRIAMMAAFSANVTHLAPAGLIATIAGQSASSAAAVTLIANATVKATAFTKMAVACCAMVLAAVGGAVLFVNNQDSANAAAPAPSQPAAHINIAGPRTLITIAPSPAVAAVEAEPTQFPNFTFILNNNPANFTTGIDSEVRHSDQPSLLLTSATPEWGILGNAMRGLDPAPYRGKRVRFSAFVKSEGTRQLGLARHGGGGS